MVAFLLVFGQVGFIIFSLNGVLLENNCFDASLVKVFFFLKKKSSLKTESYIHLHLKRQLTTTLQEISTVCSCIDFTKSFLALSK